MPGGLVESIARSTLRPGIDDVYGTKEQGNRGEGAIDGQGHESCTAVKLVSDRALRQETETDGSTFLLDG